MSSANKFAVSPLDGALSKTSMESMRSASDLSISSMHSTDHEYLPKHSTNPQDAFYQNTSLTPREALELFETAVDNARQGVQSLVGNAKATEVAKPKLTVDLRHCKLDRIPSEVVEIIRQDVERLHLAHNQLRDIPYDFTSCAALRYLNLRSNRFAEIPKAVFGLPQLEILDLSRNHLHVIPEEIDKMKALRVFAITHNNIQDLPTGLGSINTLRMLKLVGNPLSPGLRKIVKHHDEVATPSTPAAHNDENEKDKVVTQRVIEYLRSQATSRELGEDLSDGPVETPRAQSRFPVQPLKYGHSTSGSESASDQRSPGFPKSTISSRSHFRGPSFQNTTIQSTAAALRRPGLTPLALGTERIRSNSESVLQATQNTKSKRMGMVPKKQLDTGVSGGHGTNRSSFHSRGQSHGSALRNGFRPGDGSDTEIVSPKLRGDGSFVRRLSSVPEQKQGSALNDEIIEGAKGILYALHLVHPQIITILSIFKSSKAKKSSLQRVYEEASAQLDFLDRHILEFDNNQVHNIKVEQDLRRSICRASRICVLAYQKIGAIIVSNHVQIVQESDQKYIRTLMLMLYGGLNEARNARQRLLVNSGGQQTFQQMGTLTKQVDRGKMKGNSVVQPTLQLQEHPTPEAYLDNVNPDHSSTLKSIVASSIPRSTESSFTQRSRSNSRAGGIYSSASSSVASTPFTSDSFTENALGPRSRSGSNAPSSERSYQAQREHDQFEKIFLTLNKAADQGLQVIPQLEPRFVNQSENSKRSYVAPHIKDLWATLVTRTRICLETTETLKLRLSTITLDDSETCHTPDFWRLAKTFVNAYGNLLISLREARLHSLVDHDLRHLLRPVHKSTVDAASLMNDSPWNRLMLASDDRSSDMSSSQTQSVVHSRAPTPNLPIGQPPTLHIPLPQPPPPTPIAMQPPSRSQSRAQSRNDAGLHRRTAGNKGSNGSNNGVASPASSYNTSVPATPLSAALGPAAQATISTTPSSGMAGLNKSFEGDVFQRADYLQSTMRRIV